MPYRYTIKQLEEWTDDELIFRLIQDRQESLTNVYSPLNQRLQKLFNKYAQLTRDAEEERVKQK